MRSAEKTRDPVAGLWSATEHFTDTCKTLLESNPALRGSGDRPLAVAYAAIHRSSAVVPKTTIGRLRALDEGFFGQAGGISAALAAVRERADHRRARATVDLRGLDYLAPYEQQWADSESVQEMASRFAAIADRGIAELGNDLTPPLARLAANQAIRAYANDLAAAYRALGEQYRILYERGLHLAPIRHAPPRVPVIQWPVADPSEVVDIMAAIAEREVWLSDYRAAVAAWLAETWRTVLEPYLTSREAELLGWRRQVAQVCGRAADDLARATALVAEVDKAVDALGLLRGERDAWHVRDQAGLTRATRAALSEIHRATRDAVHDPWLRDRLAMLSAGGDIEVCIPVVATMKAGKSTTLGTLLGFDVAPRRSHTMTTLATRYTLTVTVQEAEFAPGDVITSEYAGLLTRIRARMRDDQERLSAHPYLARFASRVLRAPRHPPQPCRGTEAVFDAVSFVNDVARVAMLVLPPEEAAALVNWVPEVLVPAAGDRSTARLRLTLVDTPGLGEALGRDLLPVIVERALDRADGCVFVMDYTQLNSEATVALATQVSKRFGPGAGSAVWVTVNRIDQRRSSGGLDGNDVRALVHDQLGLRGQEVPVVETWAELAIAVVSCEKSPTQERLRALLGLADPHGVRFSPDETPEPREVARQIRLAARKSGLEALRAVVLDDLARRGATLSVKAAIERLTAPGLKLVKQPEQALDDLYWALSAGHEFTGNREGTE
jgi:Dynamin family